jgi:hypothetical protein
MECNLNCCCLYWTRPWLVGTHGIPRRLLINADEFELHLNSANRKYCSSFQGLKICKPGNYDREAFKLTIILAMETGDPSIPVGDIGLVSNPRVWVCVTILQSPPHLQWHIVHLLSMCSTHMMQ